MSDPTFRVDDEATRLELDYWRLLADDVAHASESVANAAADLLNVPVLILESTVWPEPDAGNKRVAASRASRTAMNHLLGVGIALERISALVDGRVQALTGSEG